MSDNAVELLDDLPSKGKKHGFMSGDLADTLRANPGKWARWPSEHVSQYSVSAGINQGRYKQLPPDQFKAVVRQGICYVRWIGCDGG